MLTQAWGVAHASDMAGRQTRNVSLTPEFEAFINQCLGSGAYGNASEVVRAGLRLLQSAGGRSGNVGASWLHGGGECGELIRRRNWAGASVGTPDHWSPEMRVTIANAVNSPIAKVVLWGAEHLIFYNDAYRSIAGDRHPEALGQPVAEAFPEVAEFNRTVLDQVRRGKVLSFRDQPVVFHRPTGPQTLYLELFYTPVFEADGRVGGVLCTMLDNSRRIDVERRLAEREAELRRVTDAAPMLVAYVDESHVYRFANAAYRDWFGTRPEEMVGRHMPEIIGEASYQERLPELTRAFAGEQVVAERYLRHRGGPPRRVELRYVPHVDGDGRAAGVHILGIDVEERARREAELAASDRRFRTAVKAVHGVLWTNSADGRMLGEQPGWAALTGQTSDQYQGHGWVDAVHPDDRAGSLESWLAAVATKSMYVYEHRVRRHCGSWRTFAIRGLPIVDDAGEIREWVGVHTDITHQRAAEAALREHTEALTREVRHRKRAEDQLRQLNETLEARVISEIGERRHAEAKLAQAQKLETVGKLTGGVAHDFNNLLQVVSGNLQLLSKDVVGNERAERRVTNALAGVSRGSKLAAQLLAFGRRQALEPRVVNITRFVQGMDDMLRRAIGEGVEIETVFAGGLWNTLIDPNQIENAILNLAINARDAMEGHGKLTIELANAQLDEGYARVHDDVIPGQYVMLAVSDTGSGMPPEVLEKVFEPFFSTKAEGKGSGLGLSMVYGFVKQSGGHVNIYSEVGHGTTIKLFLPRALESEDVEVEVENGPVRGGSETILVVEDDEEVRATVVEMLSELGYRVLKAVDADSALIVLESGVPIDLLFTDMIMPGKLKSPELARKARDRLPDLAVLFTSGYTDGGIVHGGRLDAGLALLSKPYTREALARKVRHVLANARQRDACLQSREQPAAQPRPERAPLTVLLVEDDPLIRSSTSDILQSAGHVVLEAGEAEEAVTALQAAPVDVLLTDLNLPGRSGQELAAQARTLRPDLRIVYATGDVQGVWGEAGAQLLAKPYDARALIAAVESPATGASRPTRTLDDA
jgi:putative addiction module CopG family antidote